MIVHVRFIDSSAARFPTRMAILQPRNLAFASGRHASSWQQLIAAEGRLWPITSIPEALGMAAIGG